MSLSAPEKAAGRRFRDDAQAQLLASLVADPPTHRVPNFLGLFRHNCQARAGRSTALQLAEIYLTSPAYHVYDDGSQCLALPAETTERPQWTDAAVAVHIPAGRFGFIFKQGRCPGCGHSARSPAGRLTDAWQRPPIHGRVARS